MVCNWALARRETGGLGVVRAMKQEGVPTRAVIFGSAIDEGETVEAVRLGVRGIVLKEMPRSF